MSLRPNLGRSPLSAITLGTVQLGLPYGVVIPGTPPQEDEAAEILEAAYQLGVTTLDTARAYGDAEARIGRWRRDSGHNPLVATKALPLPEEPEAAITALDETFGRSCAALQRNCIDIYLLHRASDLKKPGVADRLRYWVERGLIGRFGVSTYDADVMEAALATPGIGAIQVPLNVFDQRLVRRGLLQRARDRGVVVFVRSVFLQGLLLQSPEQLASGFAEFRSPLRRLHEICAAADCSVSALALAAARRSGATSTVIGVNSREQLLENIAASQASVPDAAIDEAIRLGVSLPETLLDPRFWVKRD